MSWHMHKNIVMQVVNLYEFTWAQENFDAGGWWETSYLIVGGKLWKLHKDLVYT